MNNYSPKSERNENQSQTLDVMIDAGNRAKKLCDRPGFKLNLSVSDPWGHAPAPLHQLKGQMLRAAFESTSNGQMLKKLCGAANEAEELAWETDYPLLLLPCLFEELAEKIRASWIQHGRNEKEGTV